MPMLLKKSLKKCKKKSANNGVRMMKIFQKRLYLALRKTDDCFFLLILAKALFEG